MTAPLPAIDLSGVRFVAHDDVDRPPSTLDLFEQLVDAVGVDAVERAVVAAAGLVDRAGDLYAALEEISPANTARSAVEIITDIALTAALGEPNPET